MSQPLNGGDIKISAYSTEYEACDSFSPLTCQQTSYSGPTGWYFRYQSIPIQITYTSRWGIPSKPNISCRNSLEPAVCKTVIAIGEWRVWMSEHYLLKKNINKIIKSNSITLFCLLKMLDKRISSSYCSCIYSYLCNRCLSPLTLWVRIPPRRGVLDATLCNKVCQWLATGRWFSPDTPVFSTNKTERHDIVEILQKVVLSTITLTP